MTVVVGISPDEKLIIHLEGVTFQGDEVLNKKGDTMNVVEKIQREIERLEEVGVRNAGVNTGERGRLTGCSIAGRLAGLKFALNLLDGTRNAEPVEEIQPKPTLLNQWNDFLGSNLAGSLAIGRLRLSAIADYTQQIVLLIMYGNCSVSSSVHASVSAEQLREMMERLFPKYYDEEADNKIDIALVTLQSKGVISPKIIPGSVIYSLKFVGGRAQCCEGG